jgi:hypothetical protein
VNFTANDFNYFYYAAYTDLLRVLGSGTDSANEILPDPNVPLEKQLFDEGTGQTWRDFFEDAALKTLGSMAVIYKQARDAGFTLPQETAAARDAELAELRAFAETNGYASLEAYLRSVYGAFMTEKSYRRVTDIVAVSDAYAEEVARSFTFTADELRGYYGEHRDMLDTYTYRYIVIRAESVLRADFGAEEEYLAARARAVEAVKPQAEALYAAIDGEESFAALASSYNAELYADADSTLRRYRGEELGTLYGDFLRGDGREYGDAALIPMPTGYYVMYFINRAESDDPLGAADEKMRGEAKRAWLGALPTPKIRRGIGYLFIG